MPQSAENVASEDPARPAAPYDRAAATASRLTNPLEEQAGDRSRVLFIIRGVFLILLVTVVMLSILRGGPGDPKDQTLSFFVEMWWVPLLVALFLGSAAISLDALTPRKKLSSMTGILFGLIAGLLATVAISFIIDLLVETRPELKTQAIGRLITAIKAAFAITLCYLGVAVVYSTQDEFRLVIPYVEFSKQLRGTRPLILDTSAIIDGRIHDIAQTGFIAAPLIVPRFVIDELQTLSDSADKLKRNRGRRGLDVVRKMQNSAHVDLAIVEFQSTAMGVDQMLLELAREHRAHLVTTDFNLNKVAAIHGVRVLNINDLSNALKPAAIPGERLHVEIVKRGEGKGQGVGYLDDGTMVVVEHAAEALGSRVVFAVTSSIQTSAGRMIFGESLDASAAVSSSASSTSGNGLANGEAAEDRGQSVGATAATDAEAPRKDAVAAASSDSMADGPALAAVGAPTSGESASAVSSGPRYPRASDTPPSLRGPSRRNPRRS